MEVVFVIFLTVISFSGVIPASVLKKNPALTQLQESVSRRLFVQDSLNTYTLHLQSGLHVWLGNGRSLLAFPIVSNRLLKIKIKNTCPDPFRPKGPDHDFAYQFQVPSEGIEGGWDASLSVDLRQAIAPCEPL